MWPDDRCDRIACISEGTATILLLLTRQSAETDVIKSSRFCHEGKENLCSFALGGVHSKVDERVCVLVVWHRAVRGECGPDADPPRGEKKDR